MEIVSFQRGISSKSSLNIGVGETGLPELFSEIMELENINYDLSIKINEEIDSDEENNIYMLKEIWFLCNEKPGFVSQILMTINFGAGNPSGFLEKDPTAMKYFEMEGYYSIGSSRNIGDLFDHKDSYFYATIPVKPEHQYILGVFANLYAKSKNPSGESVQRWVLNKD